MTYPFETELAEFKVSMGGYKGAEKGFLQAVEKLLSNVSVIRCETYRDDDIYISEMEVIGEAYTSDSNLKADLIKEALRNYKNVKVKVVCRT
jgi:hypothetical protein